MKKVERDLLLAIAEEIVLQLRAKVSEIEDLHESVYGIASIQERLLCIEDLVNRIQFSVRHDNEEPP